MSNESGQHYSLVIIGSGIAGLTAAIYAGRANNDPLVLKGDEPGGQLTLTTDVANYPGFPEGISGPDLVQNMQEQAEQFGATVDTGIVTDIDESDRPFTLETKDGTSYTADAVVVASGASARTLGIPGEDELMGFGVSTCATCDGAFFRGEDMIVVGGGDAAMEEASFLTKFADTVYIAHRRDEFRAEAHWVDRIMEHEGEGDVEILWNTEVTEVHGSQDGGIEKVSLVTNDEGHPTAALDDPGTVESELDVGAVFVAIGHTPNTSFLRSTDADMDDVGYLNVAGGSGGGQTETGIPGVFGAGDVVDKHYQQAVTAAGMGCQAAMDADEYLSDN